MTTCKESILNDLISKDHYYQTLLQQSVFAEAAYLRFYHTLSEDDQAVIDHYISLCEEMDNRKLMLSLSI